MEEKGLTQVHCRDCGKQFTLSPEEIQFFYDRLLAVPKRCEACRAKNRFALKKRMKYFQGGDR
jgi:NAD-dependent SIR2 family protein deacetylase